MTTIHEIPEIAGRECGLIRIPPDLDVPLTARVRRLIDTSPFRRLARISQLGLVSLVYPAANHSRQEHSLGVYRVAIEYLGQLASDLRFAAAVSAGDAEVLLVAALLHDVGHWPFCHPIEDMGIARLPRHEQFANSFLDDSQLRQLLRADWGIDADWVMTLLSGSADDARTRILRSLLSGPVDIDKVDYLMRDSLHAGVPYGRNFDQRRLVRSLCLNEAGDGIAITTKGKTAAELMVFARYVMFSEVYWHHAVRAATSMLQRAFFELLDVVDPETIFRLTEAEMIRALQKAAQERPAGDLLDGLFGATRRLYKQCAQFSVIEQPDLYRALARRPYDWLVACSRHLAERLAEELGQPVRAHEVLIDAPPVKLEVQFDVEVYDAKLDQYRRLEEVSPVVHALAREQFDDYVKRVRIFVHPRLRADVCGLSRLSAVIVEAVAACENSTA